MLIGSCPSSAIFLPELGRDKSCDYAWNSLATPWKKIFGDYDSIHTFHYDYKIPCRPSRRRLWGKARPKLWDVISAKRLDIIAREFLLAIRRDETIAPSSDMFFFGHGFGGLIVEQVYILQMMI